MSKLSGLLIVTSLMYVAASFGETSPKCPNEEGYYYKNYRLRNPTQGGFVSYEAAVDDETDNVFIAPTAAVCGSSSITGHVKIFGNAVVNNATISDNVKIKDDAQVIGATVSDNAVISGNAYVDSTDVVIRDKAQIQGHAKVTGDAVVGGTAIIGGYARITSGNYSKEIIKPGPSKDDVPPATKEEIARAKYIETTLDSLAQIENNFDRNDYASAKRYVEQYLGLFEEFFEKITSPDIEKLKGLMQLRKTADFSDIPSIDSKIKKLNLEISLLSSVKSKYHFIFTSDLAIFFENNKLRDTALRTEKVRIRSFIFGRTYAGSVDSERGAKQFATVANAESAISKGESDYKDIVYNW